MRKVSILFVLLAMSFASFAQTWSVDKGHSRLGFAVFHNSLAEFHGNFKAYEATIEQPKADFEDAIINVTIDVKSVNTEIEARDKHLLSEDFFDVEKFPSITFKSDKLVKKGKDKYTATGDLTIKGVTKKVTLDIEQTGSGVHHRSQKQLAGFKITSSFKRSDFGLGPNFNSVGDEAKLVAFGEFVKG